VTAQFAVRLPLSPEPNRCISRSTLNLCKKELFLSLRVMLGDSTVSFDSNFQLPRLERMRDSRFLPFRYGSLGFWYLWIHEKLDRMLRRRVVMNP
jgi:hypothetical protein